MKLFAKSLAAFAGAALAASPVVAAPAQRASQPAENASEMSGGTWVGVIGAILVVALAAIAAFDNNNDHPVSP